MSMSSQFQCWLKLFRDLGKELRCVTRNGLAMEFLWLIL